MTRPTSYWWSERPAPTNVSVIDETPKARVTFTGEDGKRFRVIVRQKPNPIGFRARLPGDGK